MKVLINNKECLLNDIGKGGGEGDIYTVNYNGEIKCVKVYDYEKRTPYNERKIIAVINKFKRINLGGIETNIAYPEIPVYDVNTKRFCGFVMKYFNNHIMISDLKYSNNTYSYGETRFNDIDIIKIVDNLFFYLRVLHKSGFILGDINPENIMVDKSTFSPAVVDFDSVQLGSFFSNSKRNDYIDPNVRVDGQGKYKYFIYTVDSDIFSLSIIAYELILGTKPHFFQTTDPTETNFKKSISLSLLDYYLNNIEKIREKKLVIEKNDFYYSLYDRLDYLRDNHSSIFNFFKSIFFEGKRYYFYYIKSRTINIKKKDGGIDIQVGELISQSKEDPEELEIFMNQFKINLP
jgi:serine/threonine protein kinase